MKTKKNKLFLSLFCILSLFFFMQPVFAESIPDRPPLNGIYDPHHYLSKEVSDKLSSMNWEYSRTEAKPQIAIAIVDNLDGDIETVANETARAWKVGYSGTDNGILLVIAIKDKKIRTETSNNLSTLITDSKASSLNSTVKSNFRRGDYSAGVSDYLSELSGFMTPYLSNSASEIKEKKSEEEKYTLEKHSKMFSKLLFIVLIILLPLTLPILLIQYLIRRYDNRYSGYTGYTENHNRGYYVSQSIKAYNDDVDSDDDYYHSKKSSSSGSSGDSSYYSGDSGSSSYYSGDSGSSSYSSGDSSSSWSGGDSWSGGGFDGGGSSGDW